MHPLRKSQIQGLITELQTFTHTPGTKTNTHPFRVSERRAPSCFGMRSFQSVTRVFFIGLNDNATAAFLDKKSRFSRGARLFIIRVGAADKFRVVEISLK
jgi:hypothetical protein